MIKSLDLVQSSRWLKVILLFYNELKKSKFYSVFHQFMQAKFDYGGSILSLSQFLLLPQLPKKMKLTSKVVIVDSKIIFSLPEV